MRSTHLFFFFSFFFFLRLRSWLASFPEYCCHRIIRLHFEERGTLDVKPSENLGRAIPLYTWKNVQFTSKQTNGLSEWQPRKAVRRRRHYRFSLLWKCHCKLLGLMPSTTKTSYSLCHTHTIPERLLGFVKKLKKKPRDIQLSREQRSHADK